MTDSEFRRLIEDLFHDEALVLGGMAEMHDLDDAFVTQLFGSLGRIRRQVLQRIGGTTKSGSHEPGRERGRRRPAIEDFLAQLDRHD